jgi:hypothetical protein
MSRNQLMIDKGLAAVLDNQRMTIREISDKLGLSFGLVQSIMTEDWGMICMSVKFFSKLLTVQQKQTPLAVTGDLLQCADQDANFMKTVITCDESLVQDATWQQNHSHLNGRLRPEKVYEVWSKVKVMLTVSFDYESVFHHEYAPGGQTVNKEYYIEVLHRLRDVQRKRPVLWK